MSDEAFEEFLQVAAQSYNAPPATVPRDEMFDAVLAARLAVPASRLGSAAGGRRVRYAWIGMAATLVIGVAIGRFARSRTEPPPAAVAQAARPVTTDVPGAPPAAGVPLASAANGKPGAPPPPARADAALYARAAGTELVRAEALLTAYRAAPPGAAVDAQLSSWARDVLSNTRLLLDSPAADDPARRQLLRDLELVLVQMVQRAPSAGAGDERSHINRSLERTQVLSRLRAALPAGRIN